MEKIGIYNCYLQDIRFHKLALKLGSMDMAIGAMVRATLFESSIPNHINYYELRPFIYLSIWKEQELRNELIEVGFAEIVKHKVYINYSLPMILG